MSFFHPELEIPPKEKENPRHPWEKIIKDAYTDRYKYSHNSVKNPVYPPPKKGRVPCSERVKFTVIGTRTEKEFIYCVNLVKGLHKYRWRLFDAPVITAVTGAEWIKIWNDLKLQYGGEAYCLQTQVAVIINGQFLGGEKELKKLIESRYIYHIRPDYYVEAIDLFSNYIKSSGRPCAYLEIMINETNIGTMKFTLYSDIVPSTCENFLRLCKETKGGYSGTPIHRIVKDGWIQCGGYGLKETDLSCENFIVPHDRRGVIAMANDGRHVDCSTQFFVLLQPQDWMAFKYVAFGQLISGEETLKKIEQVPAWYESPKENIIIAKAGILNLECQDITINKGTNKYIEGHIEDLITIGVMFYEALLEKVFLEAQFRSLQRIQAEMILGEAEITPEEAAKNLRTTQRFMRKKGEIDKQIDKQIEKSSVIDKDENNEFDVEEYEYVPEEYSYQQVSAVVSGDLFVKPQKPFYIPLTDVPYPGEVSSEFDLKRLLQGDYCLENDLEPGKMKKKIDEDIYHSEILAEMFDKSPDAHSENSLNSDDEREIKEYLQEHVDRVSFAGGVIKTIAKSVERTNIFDAQKASDLVTDETLRKFRMAEEFLRRGREKKVSITTPDAVAETHKEIIRRQTGFVRPEDLARMRQFERADDHDADDSDNEVDDYLPYTRQVSIQPPSITSYKPKAGLVRQDKERKDSTFDEIDDGLQDEIKQDHEKRQSFDLSSSPEDSSAAVPKMLIEPEQKKIRESPGGVAWRSGSDFRATEFSGLVSGKRVSDYADPKRRMSVLTRLMEDVATTGTGPTLKDYKPISENQNKTLFLLTYSPEKHLRLNTLEDDPRENYFRRRQSVLPPHPQRSSSINHVLGLQHGKVVYRKISTDYVRTIDQIEQKEQTSLRSLEYAKYRPAISVMEYRKQNKEYNEKLARLSKLSKDDVKKKQATVTGLRKATSSSNLESTFKVVVLLNERAKLIIVDFSRRKAKDSTPRSC